MSVWYSEFNSAFWLTLAGAIFGFGGVCLRAILKSRCKEFRCCGLECIRDVAPAGQEPDLDLSEIKIERSAPSSQTIKRNNSI